MTNMIQSFVDQIFAPELIRRQENGDIPKPYAIHAAQCIMQKGPGKSEIRFNEACRFSVLTDEPKMDFDRSKLTKDSNISFDLHPEDDGNAGHISIMLLADGTWGGGFSFIYNREASREHLLAADEFASAAAHSLEESNMRAFVDTFFSATELISKAFILSGLPFKYVAGGGSHSLISNHVNFESKMGNLPDVYSKLHNRYKNFRSTARYLKGAVDLCSETASSDLSVLGEYRTLVAKKVK